MPAKKTAKAKETKPADDAPKTGQRSVIRGKQQRAGHRSVYRS